MSGRCKAAVFPIILGLVFWVVDAAVDFVLVKDAMFWKVLVFDVTREGIFTRSAIFITLVVLGVIAAESANKHEIAVQAYEESNRQREEAVSEIKRTQERIVEHERLRAVGVMASGVAHDFNNLLQPILGYTELLLACPNDWKNEKIMEESLEAIHTAAEDASDVVSRLQEFYRCHQKGKEHRPIDLDWLVEQSIMLTRPRWKVQSQAKGIRIDIEKDIEDGHKIMGRASELREALTNLIFNAADALPEGGTITVRTRRDGEGVVLQVSDTGIGMTEETRRRCLDLFYTTKGGAGTGVGLSIVRGIFQDHGGKIDIDSEEGKGTTISARFPIHIPQKAEPKEDEIVEPPDRLRILLVEDDAKVRDVVAKYLSRDGHDVEIARNGREGLDKFRAGEFQVVITDRAMAGMSGDKVAATIGEMMPDQRVPVIMLTGFGGLVEAEGGKPKGVDLVVGKPVSIEKLREAIASVTACQLQVA